MNIGVWQISKGTKGYAPERCGLCGATIPGEDDCYYRILWEGNDARVGGHNQHGCKTCVEKQEISLSR
jgi:hypothetical protein